MKTVALLLNLTTSEKYDKLYAGSAALFTHGPYRMPGFL